MQAHKSQIPKNRNTYGKWRKQRERQTSQLKPKNIQPQLMTNNLKQAAYQSQGVRFFKNERSN